MNTINLRKNIIALANLPKCDEPIISAYFNLQQPLATLVESFNNWSKVARKTFDEDSRRAFIEASDQIKSWLLEHSGSGKSAAIFSRHGEPGFFLPLQFNVPMEDDFHVDSRPAIYPLVEIKDRFNRFVVALTNQDSARIVEINLGETSLELLSERPELKNRHGREWTREHYLSHSRERDKKFVKEKVAIIEQLMSKRGHNALIIAGEPRYVNRLQEALPKHLQEKVVDQIRTGFSDDRVHSILEDAINSYLKVEDGESESAVKRLFRAYRMNGLATLGVAATMVAVQNGQADQLVISSSLGHEDREKLVRLASQHNIPIETVRTSELLDAQGGAGAILRYSHYPQQKVNQPTAA